MAIKKALVIYGGSIEELHAGDSLGASGDVTGPSASTDNAIARFDGTTGKLIQDSNVTVDDNGSIGGANSLKLDTTPTVASPVVGEIYWDEGNKTPSIQLENDVNLQLGQEIVTLCYNGTGSTIPNGSVVAVTGAQGQRPSIALADADSESTSARTLGITTQAIANGAEGFITSFGFVRGLDTSAITAGVAVYLSQTAGAFTSTKPAAPAHLVHLGYVIKSHASAGEIFVTINNGWEFDELHDVLITDLQSGQIPIRDQVLGVWKNITINGTTNEVTVTSTKDGITISLPDTISASITGNAATVTNGLYTTDLGVSVQGYDADLSAIAGLTGTSGLLKKIAANTWELDTSTYLTSIDSAMVTGALGYTPYDSANPNGYINSSGSCAYATTAGNGGVTSVNGQTGEVTLPAGGGFSNTTVFTASGTFTVPSGISKIRVTVIAGGAGGKSTFDGGAGASSSFGSLISCTGGSGKSSGSVSANSFISGSFVPSASFGIAGRGGKKASTGSLSFFSAGHGASGQAEYSVSAGASYSVTVGGGGGGGGGGGNTGSGGGSGGSSGNSGGGGGGSRFGGGGGNGFGGGGGGGGGWNGLGSGGFAGGSGGSGGTATGAAGDGANGYSGVGDGGEGFGGGGGGGGNGNGGPNAGGSGGAGGIVIVEW